MTLRIAGPCATFILKVCQKDYRWVCTATTVKVPPFKLIDARQACVVFSIGWKLPEYILCANSFRSESVNDGRADFGSEAQVEAKPVKLLWLPWAICTSALNVTTYV